MSTALAGEHYCKAHQGNHSHYDEHNCTVCKLEAQLEAVTAERDRLEAMREGRACKLCEKPLPLNKPCEGNDYCPHTYSPQQEEE